jgi:hypothetical protein
MEALKRELVPVPALESDLAFVDREEPAAAEPLRISPFEDCGVTGGMKDFWDACQFGLAELPQEHRPNGFATFDRVLNNLVVDCVSAVKQSQSVSITCVEEFDPSLHDFCGFTSGSYSPCARSTPGRRTPGPSGLGLERL